MARPPRSNDELLANLLMKKVEVEREIAKLVKSYDSPTPRKRRRKRTKKVAE